MRGEVAAGGVPADADALGVGAQLACVVDDPVVGPLGIVVGGGERVLGALVVLHGQHAHAGPLGDQPARGVVGVDVAHEEATAVEEDQQRVGVTGRGGGDVEPRREPGGGEVADLADRLVAAGLCGLVPGGRAGPVDGQRLHGGQSGGLLQPQHQLQVGGEGVAVELDGLARQAALDAFGEAEDGGEQAPLDGVAGAGQGSHLPESSQAAYVWGGVSLLALLPKHRRIVDRLRISAGPGVYPDL